MTALAATFLACLSLSAVDGDTIKCDGRNMRMMGPGAPHRSGIDAPEIRSAKCQKEKLLGEQARLRLEELLRAPGTRVEDSGVHDRYGRPLVWVRLGNGLTAGETLLIEGYALPWRPGQSVDWCD